MQFRMASWWAQLGEQAAWQNQISLATKNADLQASFLPQLFQYNDDGDAAQVLEPVSVALVLITVGDICRVLNIFLDRYSNDTASMHLSRL